MLKIMSIKKINLAYRVLNMTIVAIVIGCFLFTGPLWASCLNSTWTLRPRAAADRIAGLSKPSFNGFFEGDIVWSPVAIYAGEPYRDDKGRWVRQARWRVVPELVHKVLPDRNAVKIGPRSYPTDWDHVISDIRGYFKTPEEAMAYINRVNGDDKNTQWPVMDGDGSGDLGMRELIVIQRYQQLFGNQAHPSKEQIRVITGFAIKHKLRLDLTGREFSNFIAGLVQAFSAHPQIKRAPTQDEVDRILDHYTKYAPNMEQLWNWLHMGTIANQFAEMTAADAKRNEYIRFILETVRGQLRGRFAGQAPTDKEINDGLALIKPGFSVYNAGQRVADLVRQRLLRIEAATLGSI